MRGRSAASTRGAGAASGPRQRGSASSMASRYARMVATGRPYSWPRIVTLPWCATPRPSTKRPPPSSFSDLAALITAHDRGEPAPELETRVRTAVDEVVRRQADTGIDVLNDGEMGKIGYVTYVKERLTGFDGESQWAGRVRPELQDHPDWA